MGRAHAGRLAGASDASVPTEAAGPRRVTRLDRWLAARVQQAIDPAPVRLLLWDETTPCPPVFPPVGDLIVGSRLSLLGLTMNPDLWFGEAYMKGRLQVRGSLRAVVEALTRFAPRPAAWRRRLARALAPYNSLAAARRNVHHHYDLGNEFYQLWLDPELVYTCAYYATPNMTLDDAQRAKLDHVCRKLRLRPGETVVEAGCGWGALALHMARTCRVRVKAFNVSSEQLAFARARAEAEGLGGLVEFIDDDYRNVSGRFDAFVSVGMLEHVGTRHYGDLADVLRRVLNRDTGRGLLHFIGRDVPHPVNAWIRRRIFPGGYTPTLAEVTTRILGPAEMSVVDVENLRLHYARTLAHWSEKFAAAADRVRAQFGEEFQRAWELYLAGSEAAFATGWMQLFQVLFTPREIDPPFWTRDDPYRAAGRAT